MAGTTGRPKRGTLKIGVEPDAGFDTLADALRRIGELQGCTDCGFGGFDVHLVAVKPSRPEGLQQKLQPAVRELEGINGIRDVSLQGIG